MLRRAVPFLFVLACLVGAPLTLHAQQAAAPAPARVATQAGPRLQPEYSRYEPALTGEHKSATTTAAAADRTVITISTLGLILLVVLLVILIA
jgi:hypothetical protein